MPLPNWREGTGLLGEGSGFGARSFSKGDIPMAGMTLSGMEQQPINGPQGPAGVYPDPSAMNSGLGNQILQGGLRPPFGGRHAQPARQCDGRAHVQPAFRWRGRRAHQAVQPGIPGHDDRRRLDDDGGTADQRGPGRHPRLSGIAAWRLVRQQPAQCRKHG